MGQPVRQIIQEQHPDIGVQPFYTLLIDGTNLLKISMADTKINSRGEHYGGVFTFLIKVRELLKKANYSYVYVFFDDEDSGIERYKIYSGYKANRDKKYEDHVALSEYMKKYNETIKNMQKYIFEKKKKDGVIEMERQKTDKQKFDDENFARERDILCKYFNEIYIRWMMDDKTEGDDLIAYYVQHKKPEENIVIVSGDQDLTQLISDKVCVYDPRLKKYLSKTNFKRLKGYPIENVVLRKMILGDTSDNISNIAGVSETRLMELMPEIAERPVTLNEVIDRAKMQCSIREQEKKKPLQWQENIINGKSNKEYDGDFYEINRRLIDLSTPLITDEAKEELSEMMYNAQDPEGRSFENLYQYIIDDDITELRADNKFASFFDTFKPFINKEKEAYEKEFGK